MRKWKNYLQIFKDVKIPYFLLVFYLLLSVISSHYEVNTVTLTSAIIDTTQNAIKSNDLIKYISFIIITGVLSVSSNFISGIAYQKINFGVRLKLWKKIMHLPISAHDSDNGASLITRVTTDADSSSQYFGIVISLITTVYAFFVTLRQLFKFNASMTWALLCILPFSLAFGIIYGKVMFKIGAYNKKTLSELIGYLAERVRNFRLIKSSCSEEDEIELGDKKIKEAFKSNMQATFANALNSIGSDLISLACLIISFVYGGHLVNQGILTTGRVVAFYSLSGMLTIRVLQLINYWGMFTEVNGTMERISQILASDDENNEGREMDLPDEYLKFDHVCFSYKNNEEVLHDICCSIPKGKITAIIGPNGSGKSTMFKLLERIYVPTKGTIFYGSHDIQEFQLDSYRKMFGIVSQDDMVISGTVKENICYGIERNITKEELISVAKKANIYDFVMETPHGFDAQVGQDGSNFSGGQKQCIAIARAMMRNPDYLLLDESTSNLDVKSEMIVSNALTNLMRGRTTVMIAHNYSATLMADKIIVLNNGKIEAQGSPEELLKTNKYYQFFVRQGDRHE